MFSTKIKIKEYTSASIVGKSTRQQSKKIVTSSTSHSDLSVNFLKFSTAMVKANTTSSSSVLSQAYDILVSALSLFGLLDYNHSHIKLKDGFRQKYRDFSKSGRTGELGQAINYVFTQEKLGYKYVIDFETFLSTSSISTAISGRIPDYILLGKPGCNLAILESKGSSQKNKLTLPELRAKLQGAMDNQCSSGVAHIKKCSKLKISNSFASVVEFAEAYESRDSRIHFADPEYEQFEEQDYSVVIKYFYFRWLAFLGMVDEVKANETRGLRLLLNDFVIECFGDDEFYVQKSNYKNKYLSIPVKFGISKKVVELLEMGKYQSIFHLETKLGSSENVEIFSDGTIAIFDNESIK